MKCRLWALSALLFATLFSKQSLADPPFPCMYAANNSAPTSGQSPTQTTDNNLTSGAENGTYNPAGIPSTNPSPSNSSSAATSSSPAKPFTNPKRPTILERPKLMIPLGCNRPFTYHGETYTVDSPQAADAGNLKYFISDTARSKILLDQYQENRQRSRISAYTGTAGIFLALFASGIGRWLAPRNPSQVRNASLLIGSAVAIEGISYSIMLQRRNETLLNEAVDAHNQDKPKDPVELQFSAGWSF